MKYSISKGTIVRTIMVFIVIINIVLEKLGLDIINTNESAVAGIVEVIIEVGSIIASWWYNNSYTELARKADRFFAACKDLEKTEN
ncbi:MAG: hypothetical protein E7568_02035 [Ruminococcaceae bacterium]|nr:hypothetical protein [Oscillospiraceae bacterium]